MKIKFITAFNGFSLPNARRICTGPYRGKGLFVKKTLTCKNSFETNDNTFEH